MYKLYNIQKTCNHLLAVIPPHPGPGKVFHRADRPSRDKTTLDVELMSEEKKIPKNHHFPTVLVVVVVVVVLVVANSFDYAGARV